MFLTRNIRNMKKHLIIQSVFLLSASLTFALTAPGFSQQTREEKNKIVVEPSNIKLKVDDEIQLQAKVVNERGAATQDIAIFYSRNRSSVTPGGLLKAKEPGLFTLTAEAEGAVCMVQYDAGLQKGSIADVIPVGMYPTKIEGMLTSLTWKR